MFNEIDMDGNGTIDYTEFVMATMNEKTVLTNDKLE
jgi:Ca2+-binding EF-hand superfamily protein